MLSHAKTGRDGKTWPSHCVVCEQFNSFYRWPKHFFVLFVLYCAQVSSCAHNVKHRLLTTDSVAQFTHNLSQIWSYPLQYSRLVQTDPADIQHPASLQHLCPPQWHRLPIQVTCPCRHQLITNIG